MNIDYTIIGLVFLLAIVIFFILSKRNRKDKTDLEEQIKSNKRKADRHDEPHV